MNRLQLYFLIVAIFCLSNASGQGCSDAGFCTMGAMKPDQHYNRRIQVRLRSVEASQYVGITRFGDRVINYTADMGIGISEKLTFQIKMPYVIVDGPLTKATGIGDLSLGVTRNVVIKENYQIGVTLGTKIPTGTDNQLTKEGLPLPMYNQTGLGTYDFIAGVAMVTPKWMFATGYQHAFGTTNNTFLWGPWTGNPLEAEANLYPRANGLKRGEDIMFRAERNFRFLNYNFNIGLLPIIRVTEDSFVLPSEGRIKVKGSDGMALTLLLGGGYQFSARSGIKIMNGFRLVKREKNPDGLSREFVSNIGYVYRF